MLLKISINKITSIKKHEDQKERSVSDDMFLYSLKAKLFTDFPLIKKWKGTTKNDDICFSCWINDLLQGR